MKLIIVEIKKVSRPKVWYRGKIGQTFICQRQMFSYYKVLSRGHDDFMTRFIAKKDAKKIGEVLVPEGFAI